MHIKYASVGYINESGTFFTVCYVISLLYENSFSVLGSVHNPMKEVLCESFDNLFLPFTCILCSG